MAFRLVNWRGEEKREERRRRISKWSDSKECIHIDLRSYTNIIRHSPESLKKEKKLSVLSNTEDKKIKEKFGTHTLEKHLWQY